MVMMLALIIALSLEIEAKQITYNILGEMYSVNKDEVPTFFLPNEYHAFRGYFELNFNDNTQLSGMYYLSAQECPSFKNVPEKVNTEKLSPKVCLRWNLSQLKLPAGVTEIVSFKFFPQFGLNVNPYSVRGFTYSLTSNIQDNYEFTPIFPSNLDSNPSLGPWKTDISLENIIGKSLNFVVFAYDSGRADFFTNIPILYPREITFGNAAEKLVMVYDSAAVLNPYDNVEKPTVTVMDRNIPELPSLIDGNVVGFSYLVQENNFGKYALIESREILFDSAPKFNNVSLDIYSLKCAYAVDKKFQTFVIDETSTVSPDTRGRGTYRMTCGKHINEDSYVIAIVGKQVDYNHCVDVCGITPNQIMFYEESQTYITFSPSTTYSGEIRALRYNPQELQQYAVEETSQSPLSIISAVGINFMIKKNGEPVNPKDNVVNIRLDFLIDQVNIDPYSMRMFILEGTTFKLISPDAPSTFSVDSNFELDRFADSRPVVIALFVYDYTISNIGQLNYVHYPRDVVYPLSSEISLTMKFRKSFTQLITYDNRPYFTLNGYDAKLQADYDYNFVVFSFMQQNGNGLEKQGFDENRKFVISYDTRFFIDDRELSFKFEDMRCVYLYKESNFKNPFFSNDLPIGSDSTQEYVLDCSEDIREESFVFMLVAKTFHPTQQPLQFNSQNPLDASKVGVYSNQIHYHSTLLKDSVTVSFNANSKARGTYSLNLSTKDYSTYKFNNPDFASLSLVTAFELDVFRVVFANNPFSFDKLVTIGYNVDINSTIYNFDPFSYCLMLVDDQKKEFSFYKAIPSHGRLESTFDMTTFNMKKMTLAVFAYTSNEGQYGKSYNLQYDRSLQYPIEKDQYIEISFSSSSFPDSDSQSTFSITQKDTVDKLIDDYVNIHGFSISQTVKANIFTNRVFSYYNTLLDNQKQKVADLKSLQCIYILPNRGPVFGFGVVTQTSQISYTLECFEPVGVEKYDWIIVAKKNGNPINPNNPTSGDQQGAVTFLGIFVAFLIIIIIILLAIIIGYIVYTKFHKKVSLFNEATHNAEETSDLKGYGTIQQQE